MSHLTILCVISLILTSINSLPIGMNNEILPKIVIPEETINATVENAVSRSALVRNTIRPGMVVRSYSVNLEPNIQAGSFSGQVLTVVDLTQATRGEDIIFHVSDLEVTVVRFALMTSTNFMDAEFNVDDGLLTIVTESNAAMFTILIQFQGALNSVDGLYAGSYNNGK